MICSLQRRGPDAEGIDAWDGAVLGHRRLSIFDLSEAGRQPMALPDRSVSVVFNGSIYNFRELRQTLKQRGCVFHSDSDTEVLLYGYREWGLDDLISRLRGMFAFALWDDRTKRCYLVRDRLGVKPMHYAIVDGSLAFASTARALATAGFVADIDSQAMVEYLEYGYVTDDRSIFSGASKLPAGSVLEWSGGTAKLRSYWSLPQDEIAITFDEAVEETERLLLAAVEKRLFAEVPIGSLLSGGIDSSLICWAIAKLGGDITAFTVGTPGDAWDETADARHTAESLGIRHRVLELSPDDAPSVETLVDAYGEPFACASALGMLSVSKVVKSSATVLLTGDGGDDVFLGYPEHLNLLMAQRLAHRLPSPVAHAWYSMRGLVPRKGVLRRGVHFFDYATGGLGAYANAHDGLPYYEKHAMFGERLHGAENPRRQIAWTPDSARNVLRQMLAFDRQTRFPGEYMTKVDGATMHYALEARSPFLDQDLWEFAARLPYSVRLRGDTLKAVLRELAKRRIGDRVAGGRKRGFGIPVQRWLSDKWRASVEAAMRDSVLEREGWIRSGPVLDQLNRAARSNWAPKQLWYVFVLEHWLRRQRAQTPSAQPVLSHAG